jgi:hypothetical protein
MNRFLLLLSILVVLAPASSGATPLHRLPHASAAPNIQCGVGLLDLTALAKGAAISTSDWDSLNFYWQPCGVVKTPHACKASHSGVCQVNTDTSEAVSVGDWSAAGNVTWSLLGNDGGATVSLHSAQPSCKNPTTGTHDFYRTTITLVCDESGTYPLHGPLVLGDDSQPPCFWSMSMRSPVACARDAVRLK